jgi:hypothetical protein
MQCAPPHCSLQLVSGSGVTVQWLLWLPAGMEAKGYLARAEQQIGLCVADACASLRRLAEQLASGAAGGSSGERMQELLNLVRQLLPGL